jgi:hypothetical protein
MVRLSLFYIKAENVYHRHGGYSSPRRPTHASSLDVLSPQLGCVSLTGILYDIEQTLFPERWEITGIFATLLSLVSHLNRWENL